MSARFYRPAACLLAAVVFLGGLILPPTGSWLEQVFSDWRLRHFSPVVASSPVVVLAIDDAALDLLGPWPWPRSVTANLLDRLFTRYAPAVVGMDLVFPPGVPENEDKTLAKSLQGRPIVISQLFTDEAESRGVARYQSINRQPGLPEFAGILAGGARLQAPAGHINAKIDKDGQMRRAWPIVCTRHGCSPSLAVRVYGLITGAESWRLQQGGSWQSVWKLYPENAPEQALPLDDAYTAIVPWQAKPTHRYLSIAEVWQGTAPVEYLRNHIILIGATAPALGDRVNTPAAQNFPGVETHARLLSGWLDGQIPAKPKLANHYLWGVWLLQTLALMSAWRRGWLLTVTSAALSLIPTLINLWLYQAHALQLPLMLPLLYPVLYGSGLAFARLYADRSWILLQLGSYLPGPLVRHLKERNAPDIQEETSWTTVIYADIIGSTQASQQLTPSELAEWNNRAIDLVVKEIAVRGGNVDNIAGDGLMVYWRGEPPDEQARQALAAARSIAEALDQINATQPRDWPALKMGMGIHAGPLLAGNYGKERRRYTILGDVANIAFRIERQARILPARQLISAPVAALQHGYALNPIACVTLSGVEEPVQLYTFAENANTTSNMPKANTRF